MRIPFNKPFLVGGEMAAMKKAVAFGQLSGDGPFTHKCQSWLERRLGCAKALLTHSCTGALEMAALLADLKRGDEVVLPSYTFSSTANAFVLRGARPRFVDIRPDTLNIDERLIEGSLSRRSKVIVPVHYGGVMCQMDKILVTARRHGLFVVEDAAQALGASFRGKPAGTMGHLSAISFHETKNSICGEGGALIIMDRHLIRRAEIIRQKGTNRDAFLRGEVSKYSWVDVGSSFVPSELQAAFLFPQLQAAGRIRKIRRAIYNRYQDELGPLERRGVVRLPVIPSDRKSSYHLFYVLLASEKIRRRVLDGLNAKGVNAVFHYVPLHLSKMGRSFGYKQGQFPVSEDVGRRLLRLPMYNGMTAREQEYVIRTLRKVL